MTNLLPTEFNCSDAERTTFLSISRYARNRPNHSEGIYFGIIKFARAFNLTQSQ
ncbi:hypothetical protein SAMN05660226_01179 [Parapedobacter luteus]|uniref:Uncharacterized protein n=1 Tax=Parapedobacter luteus TaxID=623280 RepID=A0A1T5AZA5_9SPHI|nr:hypothetical protein SAMN05660226_01179 [Parapedobacter luteus]